jgi:glucuronate isomerase
MDDNYLLNNRMAEILYHEYASDLPIIDYHCHLPPDEIAGDRQFANITEVWLDGDHYKWRAMRTLGIDEKYITGDASPYDRFAKWAYTVPFTIRNPLYQWTHLELKRYFDIAQLLSPSTARDIYDSANYLLGAEEYSTRGLLKKMHVEVVCTTDDPADSLEHHAAMRDADGGVLMLPAFRPDKAILIESEGYLDYIARLGAAVDTEIDSFDGLLEVLAERVRFFDDMGCKLSDHGLEQMYAVAFTDDDADLVFRKRINGESITEEDARLFMSAILYHLSKMYHEYGWVQQFHLGALRNNNRRMARKLGPDTGFDSIGDFMQARALAQFLPTMRSWQP